MTVQIPNDINQVPAEAPKEGQFAASFAWAKPQFDEMGDDERLIGVDGHRMATTSFGAMDRARSILPQLLRWGVTGEMIDRVVRCGEAVYEASTRVNYATKPADHLQPQFAGVVKTHRRLLSVANMLVEFEYTDGAFLENLKDAVGYHNVAENSETLVGALSQLSDEVLDETPLTRALLLSMQKEVHGFLRVLGKRELAEKATSAAVKDRDNSMVFLNKEYEEVRRAVSQARWYDGDADSFVPSLLAKPGAGRRKAEVPEVVPTAPATPSAAPANVAAAAPAAPGAPSGKGPMDDDPLKG